MLRECALPALLAIAGLLAPPAIAGAQGRCLHGDCENGFGTREIAEKRTHRGPWVNGVRHGHGRELGATGEEIWQGEFRNGSLNGIAIFAIVRDGRTGDHYLGTWRNGRRHGYGIYTSADGTRYSGDHVDGYREGYGELVAPGGLRYEGEFGKDRFHGMGTLDVPGIYRYAGSWREGLRHGEGEESFFDGLFSYHGSYREDRPSGAAVIQWEGREIHRGFVDPEKGYGFGLVRDDSGFFYVGELRDGRPEGRGAERTPDGDVRSGIWQSGRRTSSLPAPGP